MPLLHSNPHRGFSVHTAQSLNSLLRPLRLGDLHPGSHWHVLVHISCRSLSYSSSPATRASMPLHLNTILLQGLCHDCPKHSSPDIRRSCSITSFRSQLSVTFSRPFLLILYKRACLTISLFISLSCFIFPGRT